MDGIDGISVAQAVVAGLTWWLIGTIQDVPTLAAGGVIVPARPSGVRSDAGLSTAR